MTENRSARHSHKRSDPTGHTGQVSSAAPAGSDEADDTVIADLNDELRGSCHSPESVDPPHPTGQVSSVAPAGSDEADDTVIADLNDELRVVSGDRQWIAQYRQRGAKKWQSFSFCATKEGLIVRIKEHLLERHLIRLGHYQPKRVQVVDAKSGRPLWKRIVSRESLDETEAARAALRRGDDMASFGVAPEAWAVIEALPDHFPKRRNDK